MTTQIQARLHITHPDFQAGFDEANDPYYADCGIYSDEALVDAIRSMLTEVAVESGLSEQQWRRSTGFIVGLLRFG